LLELLQSSTPVLLASTAVIGLLFGSFLNVVIHRLPLMMERSWREQCAELEGRETPGEPKLNLLTPASRCPGCERRIAPWHNVPVVSWLWLRGRCAGCGQKISVRYPLVEAFTAIASIIVVWQLGPTWQGAAALAVTWILIAASVIDMDHTLLPDDLTLPLLWLGLIASVLTVGPEGRGLFADPVSSILGATFGYLSLWSVYWLFKLVTGKEGMGYGDFKLLAALGAWLGWQALPQIILLSAVVGAALGIAMMLFGGRARGTPIPFGPYLAAAGWIAMLWGPEINRAYLGWIGA
jgi:leader peptidase (prepilin peptidase)/N-methyltransferase